MDLLSYSNTVFYANDASHVYYTNSQLGLCNIANKAIDTTPGNFLLQDSSISFATPVISTSSAITISFTPLFNVSAGDVIMIYLPSFTSNSTTSATNTVLQIRGSSSNSFYSYGALKYSAAKSSLYVMVSPIVNITANIPISITLAASPVLVLPATGIDPINSGISFTLMRRSTVLMTGSFKTVQAIGYFMSTPTVSIDTVVASGKPIAGGKNKLTFDWKLSGSIAAGETITFSMPGFQSGLVSNNTVFALKITDNNALAYQYFSAKWSGDLTSTIIFTAKIDVPAGSAFTAIVENSNLLNPLKGIDYGSILYTVSSQSTAAPVVSTVVLITVIPYTNLASMTFLSTDFSKSISTLGNTNQIQLRPGHTFTNLDKGAQILINDVLLTIDSVANDILYTVEPYNGIRVYLEVPLTPLYTPPMRPAIFYSGSGTTQLIFRLLVRQGDYMNRVDIANATTTSYLTEPLSLNGGSLLRKSLSSALSASRNVPLMTNSKLISFESSKPVITGFNTTTKDGIYSVGDKVDFRVRFNTPVSLGNITKNTPILYLNIPGSGQSKAKYAEGSGTNTLIFIYTVQSSDLSPTRPNTLIDSSTYEPLDALPYRNVFNYIKRKASIPIVDADLTFPNGASLLISSNIGFMGSSIKVVGKSIKQHSRKDSVFTAGDIIHVYIQFAASLTVTVNGVDNPYIQLNLGGNSPVNAYFTQTLTQSSAGDTMEFTYTIQSTDVASNGLYLYCGCADYLKRTFILTTGSLTSILSGGVSVSRIIAADNNSTSLLLDKSFKIDNDQPYSVAFSSNSSSKSHVDISSPGDVFLISVQFSKNVSVSGLVRLVLKGEHSNCYANYYSGTSTSIIVFRYLISRDSGIGKAECTDISAFDVTLGSITRLSDTVGVASIYIVDKPGSINSLGVASSITVDSTLPQALSLGTTVTTTILPTRAFDITLSESDKFQVVDRYTNEANPSTFFVNSSSLRTTISNLLANPVTYKVIYDEPSSYNYTTVIVADEYLKPFTFIPVMGKLQKSGLIANSWSSLYSSQSSLDIVVTYDRHILANNAYVKTNTGRTLNKAYSTANQKSFFLRIDLRGVVPSTMKEQYRLGYNGMTTRCISVSASPIGPSSIQEALDEVPALYRLTPVVTLFSNYSNVVVYTINFTNPTTSPMVVVSSSDSYVCDNPMTNGRVNIDASKEVTFRYNIKDSDAIVLQAPGVVAAGTYTIQIDSSNKISVSKWGISPNTLVLEHFGSDGRVLSRTNLGNAAVYSMTWGSLYFSAKTPSAVTSVDISICTNQELQTNDVVTLFLWNFDTTNSALKLSYTKTNKYKVLWDRNTATITFTILQKAYCVNEFLGSSIGMKLPNTAVYENSTNFKVSISGATSSMSLTDSLLTYISPVGISNITLNFGDSRPGVFTSVRVDFTTGIYLSYHSF